MARAHQYRPTEPGRRNRAASGSGGAGPLAVVALVLALTLLIAGCSSDDQAAEQSPLDTQSPDERRSGDSILQATVADGEGAGAGSTDRNGQTDQDGGDDRATAPTSSADTEDDGRRSCGPDRPTEIRFDPGGTSATIDVPASAGQRDGYTIGVEADQIMTVRIDSADTGASATLRAPGSAIPSRDFTDQTIAPTRAGTYAICVQAGSAGADYQLFVSVIDDNVPTRVVAAWCGDTVIDRGEIRFERGSFSGSVDGAIVGDERDLYTIEAGVGQDIDLRLTSIEGNGVLDLRAPSGEMLLVGVSEFVLPLPADGVYQICVGSLRGNANYVLEVGIT